jgi:hydrogenase expression/formation protein HypD
MKHLAEYRDGDTARRLAAGIAAIVTRPWAIMEVCGGQTHSIIRNALDQLLPPEVELIHGPGCPVCVTPLEMIDRALAIAALPGTIFCSFGDMLRVPGSHGDLLGVKAAGGDVRVVYSPLDALELARRHPDHEVVFFAIGFETTAPANAMAVRLAERGGVKNFSVLVSHVLVPPAIGAVMESPGNRVEAFLAAGHVCSVMGTLQYPPLCLRYRVPIVVTGFEPLDLLEGIRRTVMQLEAGKHELENAYPRVVTAEGNATAKAVIAEVFEPCDRTWRGIGTIPSSGMPPSMPSAGLRSGGSPRRSRRSAEPGMCSVARSSRTNARPSAENVRRGRRWGRRWSLARGLVLPITMPAGSWRGRGAADER